MGWRRWVHMMCLLVWVAPSGLRAVAAQCADDAATRAACEPRVTAAATAAEAPARRYLFWKASGAGSTVYLLGSIHFGRPEMYPLSAAIAQAYARSDALVVEADITAIEPERAAETIAAKAMYRDGTTLEQHLPPALWRRLVSAASELQLPAELLARQKPWFASMTLSALAMRRYGYRDELGVDAHFLKQAGRRKVIELESFTRQIEFFDVFSEEEQVLMLDQTLDDLARGPTFLVEITAAWEQGDAERLDALLNEELRVHAATRRAYEVLIVERNAAMADKIGQLMRRGGTYFVVVGAAHLVGERGVVELLRARGYAVARLADGRDR